MPTSRYSNKRHRGPTHRGFSIREAGMEGHIPVIVAEKYDNSPRGQIYGFQPHIRAFYRHPTKGWRSTGPEGRR